MSIDFIDLASTTSIVGLPEEFFHQFEFRISITGERVTYHVRNRDSPLPGRTEISLEDLKSLRIKSQLSNADRSMNFFEKEKSEKPPNRDVRSDTVKNLIDFLRAKKKEDGMSHIERDLWLFLLREVIFMIKNPGKSRFSFIRKRGQNKAFLKTVPSLRSFFFPGRMESSFTITHAESQYLGLLPECLAEWNQDLVNAEPWKGVMDILPPVTPTRRWGTPEKRAALGASIRLNKGPFVERCQRLIKWDVFSGKDEYENPDLNRKWKRIDFLKALDCYVTSEIVIPEVVQATKDPDEKDQDILDLIAAARDFSHRVIAGDVAPSIEMTYFPLLRDLYKILVRPKPAQFQEILVENRIKIYLFDEKIYSKFQAFLRKRPGRLTRASNLIRRMISYFT